MDTLQRNIQDLWEYVEGELPPNLDDSAFNCGALVRRKGVGSAANLLRIILTYGVTDLSMKAVAAWASSVNLAEFSAVALYYRIRDSRDWLSELIATMLNEQARPSLGIGLDVVLVDATCVTGPAAKGTEWRLHTQISADTGQISAIKLTDYKVGEGYENYPVKPGQVLVGDRAYAMATGIAYVHERGGYVVARANLHSIRLCRLNKEVFSPLEEEALVPNAGVACHDVLIPAPPENRTLSHKPWKLEKARDWIEARLLAIRTIKDEVIWVITTVPKHIASDAVIMELFRVRWQIELEFKRLKSLLGLDALPSRQGPTAESWILARILAAILVEKLLNKSGVFSPWGYHLRSTKQETES
jgi:hypothetical protein